MEALQHRANRRAPAMGPEKPVFIDAVFGKQPGQTRAVIRPDRFGEVCQQRGKGMGSWSGVTH